MDFLASSTAPVLGALDGIGPALGALAFVIVMQAVPEPFRRTFNSLLVAGASGVYLSGGFGPWELWYPVAGITAAYRGLTSYRFIGWAWLMHAAWDVPHHLWGNPIWPFMPTSSFGCMVFDALIAVWFLAGTPPLVGKQPAGLSGDRGTLVRPSVRLQGAKDAPPPCNGRLSGVSQAPRGHHRFPRWHRGAGTHDERAEARS